MSKRYQIFVSSTYADLKEARAKVIQTLMEMDCLPAGMEIFPAADEEQWQFIQRVIDDCDYYLLIIGGRYGSLSDDGISYTEQEFSYAEERSLPILAFLHEEPEQIPLGKSEGDPEMRRRLAAFRDRVSTGRLVKFWKQVDELPGLVALSLTKTIKTHPAVGWVRADAIASEDLLLEVNDLRKRNEQLKLENREYVARLAESPVVTDLAGLDQRMKLRGTYNTAYGRRDWTRDMSWNEIFWTIAPSLMAHPNDLAVKHTLQQAAFNGADKQGTGVVSTTPGAQLNSDDFETIKIQLMAHQLVDVSYLKTTKGGMGLFWSLTNRGRKLMMELRTVRNLSAEVG